MKTTFKSTLMACYVGYISQAIVNNLAPLLFIIFRQQFHISYEMIGRLILINFGTQLLVDYLAIKFIDQVGYRISAVMAHILCAIGLVLLGILPNVTDRPYLGLVAAVVIYAIGGGLIEVLISPIVDSLPGDAKASAMSLLHSFYCWGQVGVVFISTIGLKIIGESRWMILPILWAVIPLVNAFSFSKVPMTSMVSEEERMPLRQLLKSKVFLLAMFLMTCAAASEQAMAQWASLFAEKGLGVPKVFGDLLGPCLFAVFMGSSRLIYGIMGERIPLKKALIGSSLLCMASYLAASLSPNPILSLLGCAICGFSVGLMWPGMFSLTAAAYPRGGTAMFGILALMGDAGCAFGPWAAGLVSDGIQRSGKLIAWGMEKGLNADQLGLKAGLFLAVIFPIGMLIGVSCLRNRQKQEQGMNLTAEETFTRE